MIIDDADEQPELAHALLEKIHNKVL